MKRRLPYVTIIIGIICVGVYLIQWINGYADNSEGMILFGAYYKPFILAGEWWRLITVGFVHANVWHLMINMMSLYALGTALEPIMPKWKYLVILIGSVIGGSAFLLATPGNSVAVGLSGGLYGLMMTYTIIMIRAGGWKIPRVRYALLSTLMINFLINFMPGVSWIAHLGGAVTGFLLTGVLYAERQTKQIQRNYAAAGAALLLCVCVLCGKNAEIPNDQVYLLSDYHILMAEKKVLPEAYIKHMAYRLDTIYGSGTILQDAIGQKEA